MTDLVEHSRDLRAKLNDELPNGVGNTIDALCDTIESLLADKARLLEALVNAHHALKYWDREARICGEGAKWIEGPLERNQREYERMLSLNRSQNNAE